MRDRLLVLGGAVLALALVIGLLIPQPQQQSQPVSTPTSADRGSAGLAAAQRWLEARGTPIRSLRVRYQGLADLPAPHKGHLLVMHLPRLRAARPNELDALRQWLARGNTAVVLAAIAHRPGWLRRAAEATDEGLGPLDAGLERASKARGMAVQALKRRQEQDPDYAQLEPLVEHPLTRGVERLAVAAPVQPVERNSDGDNPWLGLFGRDGHTMMFWRAYGEGGLLVSGHPGPFANAVLDRADNAQLLANLVAHTMRDGGHVVFDDFHAGLSRLYDAEAFFSDPRLHATLAFLLAFWLLYAVGYNNRLAPPYAPDRTPRASDFTEAVAGLLARRCRRPAVASALLGHFFDRVRRRHGLPENGRPAWACLEANTAVDRRRLERLQHMAARVERGRRVSLTGLTRAIAHIEECLR